MTLEGLSRHSSVHAAGVVIAPGPLDEYVPICTQSTKGSGGSGDGEIDHRHPVRHDLPGEGGHAEDGLPGAEDAHRRSTTRWPPSARATGRCGTRRRARSTRAPRSCRWTTRPSTACWRAAARRASSSSNRSLATEKLRQMKADRFDDLIATNALLRPGPLDMGMDQVYIRRKLGQEPVRYPHPELAEVLEPTYGVIVYQEQVMRIAQILAGFTPRRGGRAAQGGGQEGRGADQEGAGRSSSTRRWRRGTSGGSIQDLADQIEAFGRYGFNKSHSAAYGLVAYQTAWLKAHYPAEFMAALLVLRARQGRGRGGLHRRLPRAGQVSPGEVPAGPGGAPAARERVQPASSPWWARGSGQIRFGLAAIRGVGEGAVRSHPGRARGGGALQVALRLPLPHRPAAVQQAGDGGADLRRRARRLRRRRRPRPAARRPGGHLRRRAGRAARAGELAGQPLRRAAGRRRAAPACWCRSRRSRRSRRWPESERLKREKEILGFFISGHPLDKYREEMALFDGVNTANLKEHRDRKVELACVVTEVARQISQARRLRVGPHHRGGLPRHRHRARLRRDAGQQNKELLQKDTPVLRPRRRLRPRARRGGPADLPGRRRRASPRCARAATLGICIELAPPACDPERTAWRARTLSAAPGPAPLLVLWRERRRTEDAARGCAPHRCASPARGAGRGAARGAGRGEREAGESVINFELSDFECRISRKADSRLPANSIVQNSTVRELDPWQP